MPKSRSMNSTFALAVISIVILLTLAGCTADENGEAAEKEPTDTGASVVTQTYEKPTPVPTYKGDLHRTGYYETPGIRELPEPEWTFKAGDWIVVSPVISGDSIYFGSKNKNFYAVDVATGEEKWKFTTKNRIYSSPAVEGDSVYFGSKDDYVYSLDTVTGEERWKFQADGNVDSSPAISDGVLYVGSDDGHLYALDLETGEPTWNFKTGDIIWSSPAIYDGKVYFGGVDGWLYVLDAGTGQELWKFETTGGVYGAPVIGDEKVFFGQFSGDLIALDLTGREVWRFDTFTSYESSPAFADGVLYAGTGKGRAYALDSESGETIWEFQGAHGDGGVHVGAGGVMFAAPALVQDMLYVANLNGTVYGLDRDTGVSEVRSTGAAATQATNIPKRGLDAGLWEWSAKSTIRAAPVAYNGMLYVVSNDAFLYALR